MTEFVPAKINDRWELMLPEFRRQFHSDRPEWEAGRLASCAETMFPGAVVWDIGAEQGDFTALYRQWVGPGGRVVAVEPSPPYWPCVRQTWEANGFGEPPGWFVGFASNETSGAQVRSTVADEPGPDGWPACSVGQIIPDFGFRHLAQQTNETPQVRLDELAEPAPDVITIDIEGAEWHCLSGCAGLFETVRPLIYVSVHDRPIVEWYDRTFLDLHRLMLGFDYDGTFLPYLGEGETMWLYAPR